jgi:hypothetical protein
MNDNRKLNYVFFENTGVKSTNEVVTIADILIGISTQKDHEAEELRLYLDETCGIVNYSSVIKYLQGLVDMKTFKRTSLNIICKGHMKNPARESFGKLRAALRRKECWTPDEYVDIIKESTGEEATVISKEKPFEMLVPKFDEMYKKVQMVSKFSVFSIDNKSVETVHCFETPNSTPRSMITKKKYDGVYASSGMLSTALDSVEAVNYTEKNREKNDYLEAYVLSAVPEKYKNKEPYCFVTQKRQDQSEEEENEEDDEDVDQSEIGEMEVSCETKKSKKRKQPQKTDKVQKSHKK